VGQVSTSRLSFSSKKLYNEVSKITWNEITFNPINLYTIGALWKNA